MTTALDTLYSALTDQASALIRDEVRAGFQRERLAKAVYDSIVKMGADINDVSAATGLRIEDIKQILENPPAASIEELFGLR